MSEAKPGQHSKDHHVHHKDSHTKEHHGKDHHGKDPHHKDSHTKEHHGKDHHGKDPHHKDSHHHGKDKHPTLRGATINPVQSSGHRPRAGTIGRKDTAHSIASVRDHRHKEHDRHSTVTDDHHHQPALLENTFKMAPDCYYREGEVKQIISAVLKDHITEKTYDSNAMKTKSLMLSSKILDLVKRLEMKRFKFVCLVMIGEKGSQSMQFSSRCLWDQRFDNYSTVHFTQGNIHATGIVYAAYAE